jgi:quercetin dioxygenase-like cupin family protein
MSPSSAVVIADVASELPIPEGGVLSRTLHRSEEVRLVGFAFDRDQELTEHSSALAVTIQVVRGRLAVTLGDDPAIQMGPASWLHLPPRLPHSVRALEPTVMLLTMHTSAS